MRLRSRVDVDPIVRAVDRIRARATARSLFVRVPYAIGASLVALLVGSAAIGPSPAAIVVVLVIALAFAPFLLIGVLAAREIAPLAGNAAPRAIASSKPWLASALRSASELGTTTDGSQALLDAHRTSVTAALRELDLDAELQLAKPARRAGITAVTGILIAVAVARFEPHVAAGLYAVSHPMARRDGDRLALVVSELRVRVTPPRHRGGAPSDVTNPSRLAVDEGTKLALDVELRLDARSVDVDLAGTIARLERVSARRFRGETTARATGPIAIRARTEEERLVDAVTRRIDVRDDAPPAVRVLSVLPESHIRPDTEVSIEIEATDDVGVHELVELVRGPSGDEIRTVLATPEAHTPRVASSSTIRLETLGVRAGDTITVTYEATDEDSVDGPKTTRTEPIAIVVDDGREARDRASADLRTILDESVASLATRLETPIPTDAAEWPVRAQSLATSSRSLADRLRTMLAIPSDEVGLTSPDRGLLRGFERRLEALATSDIASATRSADAIARTDAVGIAATEDIVLALADLLGRLELQDAASLAREIAALQRELGSLVRELRENPSDSIRAAIRATMQRIRQRMAELSAKLSSTRDELPAEFRNAAQQATAEAGDALAELERALAEDDLDAAERSVAELEQALRDMTQSSEQTEDELSETRFGPRQQAFAAAFESLAELEVEQTTLSNDSARIRDGLSERAAESLGDERSNGLAPLAAEARRIDERLRRLDQIPGAPVDKESLRNARARLDDAREALSGGNLGEAREMMNRATGTVEAIASDLELSRRMFDALDRRVAQAAETARDAADAMRALDDQVTRALPSLQAQMRSADQAAMAANRARQVAARESAGRIAEALGGDSLGEPISPDVAEGLGEAQGMMAEAETALGSGDSVGAANAEARAARRLRELREQIEQQTTSSSSSGGGGGSSGSSSGSEHTVEVPSASTSEDAAARRRRVLDAMGEDVPDSYRGPVRRYYEELLR